MLANVSLSSFGIWNDWNSCAWTQKSLGKSNEMKSSYKHTRTWNHRAIHVLSFSPATNVPQTVCMVKRVICYSFNLTNVSISTSWAMFPHSFIWYVRNVSDVFFVPVIVNVAVGCGRAENTQFQQSGDKKVHDADPTSKMDTHTSIPN